MNKSLNHQIHNVNLLTTSVTEVSATTDFFFFLVALSEKKI